MAENNTQQTETTDENQGAQQQPEVDWKAEARKWEQRAKENREAAKRLAELEEANKTDAEKLADATKRAEEAEKQIEVLRHAEELRTWAAEVSSETHVPASVLRGETKEEMQEHAKQIIGSGLSSYGSVPDSGESEKPEITREQIEAIKDPHERVLMRAKHINLYK